VTRRQAFTANRRSAKQRGIAWNLTYEEWVAIWDASGNWNRRGRGRDRYCMARKGDSGPYETGNVYVCTNLENCRDFRRAFSEWQNEVVRIGQLARTMSSRGWTFVKERKQKPYQVQLGRKYIGRFSTQAEAEAAFRAAIQTREEARVA